MIESSFYRSLSEEGCEGNRNSAIVVHGWFENFRTTPWINETVKQLVRHRGGCVYVMDYSTYAEDVIYFRLVARFDKISSLLTRKFAQIGNYEQLYCFGFSFGSRLCIDASISLGDQMIGHMDLCEPVGPGFDWTPRVREPKKAAKNVACINTSSDKGTSNYNCHQNFRMGSCGDWQEAAGPYPLGSHGLCPYIFNSAFDYKFIPNNLYNCNSKRLANLTEAVRLGYLGSYDKDLVQGDIFIATAKYPPYLIVDDLIDNKIENT